MAIEERAGEVSAAARPPTDRRQGDRRHGPLVDATHFLDFTHRLHSAAKRVDQADVTQGRRSAWQGRLIAISESAQVNMLDAEAMLERLVADLDRHLPR